MFLVADTSQYAPRLPPQGSGDAFGSPKGVEVYEIVTLSPDDPKLDLVTFCEGDDVYEE